MLDNIKKRLAKWKDKHLSFAGRVTLTKSVITIVSLLYMFVFKVPPKLGIKSKENLFGVESIVIRKLHGLNEGICVSEKRRGD